MIADTIKQLRERTGFTQSELAKKLNITRSSVNAWEMGISAPSTQYIVELADIFKVTTDYILGVSDYEVLNISNLTEKQMKALYAVIDAFETLE
ncbi:MAG: helix-turn-helix transcriptional regulator [Faecalibacterium sp.]